MRAPESATMLCRVLLGLDRSSDGGTLHLQGTGRAATLSFEDGRVVAANVDRRVASSRRQLFEGVLHVCEWERLCVRFAEEPSGATWWKLHEHVRARDLALDVMREVVQRTDEVTIRSDLGDGAYHLTDAGEALVAGAELRPEESVAVCWLRRGVRAEDIQGLQGCGPWGYRFAWLLKRLRAAAPRACGSYPLLLRKRRELRGQASVHALLDLPEGAGGGEARRALRKLVRHLHPDRFGDGVPPALRRASGEIVAALVDAEAVIAAEAAG